MEYLNLATIFALLQNLLLALHCQYIIEKIKSLVPSSEQKAAEHLMLVNSFGIFLILASVTLWELP